MSGSWDVLYASRMNFLFAKSNNSRLDGEVTILMKLQLGDVYTAMYRLISTQALERFCKAGERCFDLMLVLKRVFRLEREEMKRRYLSLFIQEEAHLCRLQLKIAHTLEQGAKGCASVLQCLSAVSAPFRL